MKQALTSLPAALSRAFRGGWRNNLLYILDGALISYAWVGPQLISDTRLYLALAVGALVCLVLTDRLRRPRGSGRRAPGWGWSLLVLMGTAAPVCASAGFGPTAWLWTALLFLLAFTAGLFLDLRS